MKEHSAIFSSEPANRTHHRIPNLWNRFSSSHALGNILQSIGYFGSLVFLLRKFIDHFDCKSSELSENQIHHCSLVSQAFAIAVGKVLEGYLCALGTLDASTHSRHSSNAVNVSLTPSFGEGSLTSVTHSGITLLEAYLHTRELRTKIEALGSICNLHYLAPCFLDCSFEDLVAKATLAFDNFPRGGDLLTYLYTQLQVRPAELFSVLHLLSKIQYDGLRSFFLLWHSLLYYMKFFELYQQNLVYSLNKHSCRLLIRSTVLSSSFCFSSHLNRIMDLLDPGYMKLRFLILMRSFQQNMSTTLLVLPVQLAPLVPSCWLLLRSVY